MGKPFGMNIDLFVSKRGRVCLVSDEKTERGVESIRFNKNSYTLILVYEGSLQPKTEVLNVPVDYAIAPYLLQSTFILMGVVAENKLVNAAKIPLYVVEHDDEEPPKQDDGQTGGNA